MMDNRVRMLSTMKVGEYQDGSAVQAALLLAVTGIFAWQTIYSLRLALQQGPWG